MDYRTKRLICQNYGVLLLAEIPRFRYNFIIMTRYSITSSPSTGSTGEKPVVQPVTSSFLSNPLHGGFFDTKKHQSHHIQKPRRARLQRRMRLVFPKRNKSHDTFQSYQAIARSYRTHDADFGCRTTRGKHSTRSTARRRIRIQRGSMRMARNL